MAASRSSQGPKRFQILSVATRSVFGSVTGTVCTTDRPPPGSREPPRWRSALGRVICRAVTTAAATSFPKDRIKVLLLENIHPSAHELFRGEGFHLETLSGALGEEELIKRVEDVHVLG